MELQERTRLIQFYSKAVKSNFLTIGNILLEIRDKKLFKEEYDSFKEYLENSDFQFTRQYAYNMMDVIETNVKSFDKLSISQWIHLTHVTDKQEREKLAVKAEKIEMTSDELGDEVKKINKDYLFKKNTRAAQREDTDLETKQDSKEDKRNRIFNEIMNDGDALINQVKIWIGRINNWITGSGKEEDKVNALKEKEKELRGV